MKHLSGRTGWVYDLGSYYGSIIRVNRGLKPWEGVWDSGATQRLPTRIRYHIRVEKNAPWMGSHLRRKLVMIFVSELERESSKR